MIVSVGDNFYPRGVESADDKLWTTVFQEVYNAPALKCPWYSVLGNHDRDGNPEAQIAFQQVDPRWHMPSRYYSHIELLASGAGVEFFFLDTTLLAKEAEAPEIDQDQLDWLDGALSASKANWRVVAGHHPVFSGGHHGDTPALVARLKPILDRHKVQVFLNGHDHDMQHIAIDGVQYLTAGSGSKTRPTDRTDGTLFAESKLGFLKAKFAADMLDVDFVGTDGEIVYSAKIPVA
jgi:tartrate-resistant acid phosphatase type 5